MAFHQRRWRYIRLLGQGTFNLRRLFIQIQTEDDAIEAALSWLMIPDRGIRCTRPNCRSPVHKEWNRSCKIGWGWRCNNRQCRKFLSSTTNTFFEHSHLPIRKLIPLMYFWFTRLRISDAAKFAGVSRVSAIQVYHYCREVCEVVRWHDVAQIGGPQDVVEVDEAHLFTNKYHRGRQLRRQIWVFGMISRLTKNMYIQRIENKASLTLVNIMRAQMVPGSFIMSDCHRSYRHCDYKLGMRGHATVNHRVQFVNGTVDIPVNPALGMNLNDGNIRVQVHTNNVERHWRKLKDLIRTCREQQRLNWYISEFLYRQNVLRHIDGEARQFRRFLADVGRVYPGPGRVGIRN